MILEFKHRKMLWHVKHQGWSNYKVVGMTIKIHKLLKLMEGYVLKNNNNNEYTYRLQLERENIEIAYIT